MINIPLLPYASFHESVESYSDFTLYCTLALLLSRQRCLSKSTVQELQWREHETWLLWQGWKQAYIRLTMMCIDAADLRDISYSRDSATHLLRAQCGKHWHKPLWVGWSTWHSSNRAALLHLGEVEKISHRLIKWEKLEKAPKLEQWKHVAHWYRTNDFTAIAESNEYMINEAHQFLDTEGAPRVESVNYYEQFNWTERPCGRIPNWPPEPGESWLCEASQV